jgi:hypothetical protein
MASYQIPQFLDSGDKILGPLNVRQFGYALGGGFLSVLVFTSAQSILPGIGNYAVIPLIPIVALTAYLGIGKYNGRDTEVYVLKMILYLVKPRIMKFTKIPDINELNSQKSKLTYSNILTEWNKRIALSKEAETNILTAFSSKDSQEKAKRIRNLGVTIDQSLRNSLTETVILENKKQRAQNKINQILQKPGISKYTPNPILENPNIEESVRLSKLSNEDFFKEPITPTNNKLSDLKKKFQV